MIESKERPPVVITGRHVSVTEPMRDHAQKKLNSLHLEYPKIIDAKVILDVQKSHRHMAEIILHCANHITIEASSVTNDMYASIDETISKIARRMRKRKTRLLKSHRAREGSIRFLDEQVFPATPDPVAAEPEEAPVLLHTESYSVKPLFPDEAMMEMEMGDKPFVLFENQKNHKLSILFRRKDGEYGMIQPELAESGSS